MVKFTTSKRKSRKKRPFSERLSGCEFDYIYENGSSAYNQAIAKCNRSEWRMTNRMDSAATLTPRRRKSQLHWQLLLMVLPALIYLLIFHYKPMYGVVIAFKNYKFKLGILGSPWCGLENFQRLFSSYWFPIILKNTLTISILSLVMGFPMPILLALMVNEIEHEKIKRTFQTISYAPHFISTIVVCGMVFLFTNPNSGIINKALGLFGLELHHLLCGAVRRR